MVRMTAGLRIGVAGVLIAFVAVCGFAQGPVMGRYVRVEIPKEKSTLILAEVQVFSKGENVALKRTATQSGTLFDAEAKLAIDGNTDGEFNNKSVTHTKEATCPWWEVDLGTETVIERIVIWNRTDYPEIECFMRLNGCRVVILDGARKEVWEVTIPEPGKVTELAVKVSSPLAGAAVPATVPELKNYQEIFEKTLAGLVTEQKAQARALSDKYLATLKLLQERAKKAGNLDYLLVLTAETGRVTQSQPVTANAEQDVKFAELKGVRDAYLGALRMEDGKTARKIVGLAQQYERTLAALQADLTRKDRISDAMAAKTEREGLEGRPEFAWAKAVMENAATAVPLVSAPAATGKPDAKKDLYMVIDLSRGEKAAKGYPVSYLSDMPKGGWTDEYKKDKLVLRRIEPGTFMMGSPEDEVGHAWGEKQHEVTLTKAFYIGVFEVTQKQWERVMGEWRGCFSNASCRDERPVERVSYNALRGAVNGINWPVTNTVDSASFMGRLRERAGRAFDLPTEAQWEYACRAGTPTALNSGKNLSSAEADPNMAEVGRYKDNAGNIDKRGDTRVGTAKVGSYIPNAWGLYDMHGNVWEWCLDWWDKSYSGTESDPKGAASGVDRILRSGNWTDVAGKCRSASRSWLKPAFLDDTYGFRVTLTLP